MSRRFASLAAALLLVAATAVRAQQPRPTSGPVPGDQGPKPGPDPLMSNLFSPETIMQNQEAIALTDEQRRFCIEEIQRTQAQATAIQWRLQAAMERLGGAVRPEQPDEGQVLAQLDSVLSLEREMKRTQIALLVRLKARLTPRQQAELRFRIQPREF